MQVTATLKFVLREVPDTHEQGGTVAMTLTNEPRGLPKDSTLASSPLAVTCAVKQWKTACTKAEQIRASGLPALLIVEAHVAAQDSALVGIIKGIQVVEGKPAAPAATGA
jgi:hypothetical protein